MTGFATKEELAQIRGALNAGLTEIRGELRTSLAEVRGAVAGVKGELETKIAEVKSDVLRWMFAFFVTMLLAILGLYFKK
jgi:hypothetical protein